MQPNSPVPFRPRLTLDAYFRCQGSGGLEVHVESDTYPFDTVNNELIDFDIVLRDEVDLSTISVHVGCGGCVQSADPIVEPPFPLDGYERREVEPL